MQVEVSVLPSTTAFLRIARAPCFQASSNVSRQSAGTSSESLRTMFINEPLSAGPDAGKLADVCQPKRDQLPADGSTKLRYDPSHTLKVEP